MRLPLSRLRLLIGEGLLRYAKSAEPTHGQVMKDSVQRPRTSVQDQKLIWMVPPCGRYQLNFDLISQKPALERTAPVSVCPSVRRTLHMRLLWTENRSYRPAGLRFVLSLVRCVADRHLAELPEKVDPQKPCYGRRRRGLARPGSFFAPACNRLADLGSGYEGRSHARAVSCKQIKAS